MSDHADLFRSVSLSPTPPLLFQFPQGTVSGQQGHMT